MNQLIEIPMPIYDEEYCPECGHVLHVQTELRAEGKWEEVAYCDGCGFTEA